MIRSVIQLFAGASMAQAITMASTIFLARSCYGPDAFGQFAIYWAWSTILSTLGTFRFESLIMLPDTDDKADALHQIAAQSLKISCLFAGILVLLFCCFRGFSWSILVIPLGGFFIGKSAIFNVLLARLGLFAKVGRGRLMFAISTAVVQWCLFIWLPVSGLVVGSMIGAMLSMLVLKYQFPARVPPLHETVTQMRTEYQNMRRLMLRSTGLNVLYQYMHPVLVFKLFGELVSGHFFMAQKLLQAPVGLVTSSISQVFYREAGALRYHSPERLFGLMIRVAGTVGGILAIPMFVMAIWGDELVVWLLGPKWIEAGSFLSLLVLLVFSQGLYSPVSSIAEVVNRVDIELITNIYFIFEMIFSLTMGWYFNDFRLGLTCFVWLTSLGYFTIFAYFLRLTWRLRVGRLTLR